MNIINFIQLVVFLMTGLIIFFSKKCLQISELPDRKTLYLI